MKSIVYFYPLKSNSSSEERLAGISALTAMDLWEHIPASGDLTAIKVHVGEELNTTYIKPPLVKAVVDRIKKAGANPFLTETSTLYKGERENAVSHINLAHRKGFTPENVGAPFILADGLLGTSEVEVQVEGQLYQSVKLAREVMYADSLVVITHATGHIGMGFGGSIKNIGMGLSSRKGKRQQHSTISPYVNSSECTFCRKCMKWCPEDAIFPDPDNSGSVFIQREHCIGCGECLAVCPVGAVKFNWEVQSGDSQQRVAEHALGIISQKRGKVMFINFLIDMTRDCDCVNTVQEKVLPDVGILVSTDPVAIDQATLDLTARHNGAHLGKVSYAHLEPEVQIRHGEAVGLGSRTYELIEIALQ